MCVNFFKYVFLWLVLFCNFAFICCFVRSFVSKSMISSVLFCVFVCCLYMLFFVCLTKILKILNQLVQMNKLVVNYYNLSVEYIDSYDYNLLLLFSFSVCLLVYWFGFGYSKQTERKKIIIIYISIQTEINFKWKRKKLNLID